MADTAMHCDGLLNTGPKGVTVCLSDKQVFGLVLPLMG